MSRYSKRFQEDRILPQKCKTNQWTKWAGTRSSPSYFVHWKFFFKLVQFTAFTLLPFTALSAWPEVFEIAPCQNTFISLRALKNKLSAKRVSNWCNITHKKWNSMSFYCKFISNYKVEFTKCVLFVIIQDQCISINLSTRIKKLGTWELIRTCDCVEMKNWNTFIQKLLTFGLQITSNFSVKSFSTADLDMH